MLEDLGLRVIEEISTRLLGDHEAWVQEFRVLGPDGAPLDLEAVGDRVAELLAAIHRGAAETDNLNRLVITAGLDRRQVAILRAYRKYRQRVGTRFTESYQNDVLVANSALTAKLVRYFELRFDPELETDEAAEEALREEILADLDEVASLDHDRILRNQLTVIDATLRTNAYNRDHQALAFKLKSADVPAIPQPAPYREIYVYSPEVEGIHLRGGPIARGGLRWSDRQDYRTEVFGLMRAQLTKNAVIVPAGAKGGFYIKQRRTRDVEKHYVTFIRSLLSVTDNLVEGRVVQPEAVRVRDGEDTYLVVAADKGTATFSDTANRVSREFGFWLDDGFASGGSAGYDHKALGITAKGAWESVKRHFKELGVDTQADEFTVVGIGDMSGDVFGNGMLLSHGIRLVAAYDHRHIFIDPVPDAAVGFAERQRLFDTPRSSWDDYSRELISEGGGVWPRTAKSIRLSPQAREALGVSESALPPTEVIRAILRAPVDLLWNGGIGTVVKASTESDADAADRSSDAIRVNGSELRAKVVGEGGNLGLTRRARIEYASLGGRINADFIDNSAGVDCSDHEVNLKILLGLAEQAGELTREGRDELLLEVTDDVVAHVLYDSFLQAQIIAQEVERSASRLFAYEDLMIQLEELKLLDRASEDLPTSEEIGERRRAGRGMERPELATLLTYAKQLLARTLENSDFVEEPWLERDLRGYFPPAVVKRFGSYLGRASTAQAADLHGQLQRGRQRARPDLHVAAGGRARRRAGRRRARLPDRPRGHRRRCALGGRRAAGRCQPRGPTRAHDRRRLAGRGHHSLVLDLGTGRRHPRDDLFGPRRLRAVGRRARLTRHRRAQAPPRTDLRTPRRRRRLRVHRPSARPAPRAALRAGHGVGRRRDRRPDRAGRRGLLRGRRRTAPRLDRRRARPHPRPDPHAALGAAGRPRRRSPGPARARGQRPRRVFRRRRGLPLRTRRGAAALHVVPALPLPRRRTRPGGVDFGCAPVARVGLLNRRVPRASSSSTAG